MEDFTGGVVESYDLAKATASLFPIMAKAAKKKALMSCSIKASPGETEAVMANGLVKGHAYSVTGARQVGVAWVKGVGMGVGRRSMWQCCSVQQHGQLCSCVCVCVCISPVLMPNL